MKQFIIYYQAIQPIILIAVNFIIVKVFYLIIYIIIQFPAQTIAILTAKQFQKLKQLSHAKAEHGIMPIDHAFIWLYQGRELDARLRKTAVENIRAIPATT